MTPRHESHLSTPRRTTLISTFDQKLIDFKVQNARERDDRSRRQHGLALIHTESLMRELVRHMPDFDTEIEQQRYLEAVKDIAIHVSAAPYRHDPATGELHTEAAGPGITSPSKIVDEALAEEVTPA